MNVNYVTLSLVPFMTDEMKRVEQMMMVGADKLSAVVNHVKAVYEATSGPAAFGVSFEDVRTKVVAFIEGQVNNYHEDGTFVKQQKLAA